MQELDLDFTQHPAEEPRGGCGVQAAKDVQAPTVGKLQSKADSLEELGSQKLNSQQRQAVASVLVGAGGGTRPLALFGPPGTGKTVTLVECALQVTISTFLSEKK